MFYGNIWQVTGHIYFVIFLYKTTTNEVVRITALQSFFFFFFVLVFFVFSFRQTEPGLELR